METVYVNKELSSDQKWIRWWKMLYPEAGDADIPDPRHQVTFVISEAYIPAYQEVWYDMWKENELLPALDDSQKRIALEMLDRVLRLSRTIHRYRRQRNQSRTPSVPTSTETMARAAGSSPSFSAAPQRQDDSRWSPASNLQSLLDMNEFTNLANTFDSDPPNSLFSDPTNIFGSGGLEFTSNGSMPYGQNTCED